MTNNIRRMKFAGQFYPKDPITIQTFIDENLNKNINHQKKIKSIIIPHAGYVYSGRTAIKTIAPAINGNYENIFIIAPSHYVKFNGLALSSFNEYETPFGNIPVNTEIVQELSESGLPTFNEAHIQEHSLEVQLPLIKNIFPNAKIIPIICGFVDSSIEKSAIQILEKYWLNDNTIFLISSDFTHFGRNFGYMPFTTDIKENLKSLDGEAIKHILNISSSSFKKYLEKTSATICGRIPISIMLKLAEQTKDKLNLNTKLIEYTTSGEVSGDYNHCVSYAGIIFFDQPDVKLSKGDKEMEKNSYYTQEQKTQMLSLARKTIEAKFQKNKFDLNTIPDYLNETRSCFVTLHKSNGDLRGCIGNIEAFESLYDNIKHNAENSAFGDPRFQKLNSLDELNSIEIEISVLTPKQKVNSYKDITLGKHGIILKAFGRGAVFLPQVAPEQGWDIATTLTHLSLKAGLPQDIWKKNHVQFEVFEAIVFGE